MVALHEKRGGIFEILDNIRVEATSPEEQSLCRFRMVVSKEFRL